MTQNALTREQCGAISQSIKDENLRLIFNYCIETGTKYEQVRKRRPDLHPPVIQVWNRDLKRFAKGAGMTGIKITSRTLTATHKANAVIGRE